jgi:ABC-type transporter Mla subunit MlaD
MITPEIKAGLFLAFCLGLFVAMLFLYGKATRRWRGRETLHAAFTHVRNLRGGAQVLYNGLEVGRVRSMALVVLDAGTLKAFAPFGEQSLERLPLTDEEKETLRGVAAGQLDAEIRRCLLGRSMVLLKLDVLGEGDQKRYREDDQVRVTTTLMGESAVEIISGSGPPLQRGELRLFLGSSGDMYGSLAKSMSQMRDILASVTEIIGGGEEASMGKRASNFDQFTARLETLAGNIEEKLPRTWDTIEARLAQGQERSAAYARRVAEVKPDWTKTLDDAQDEVRKFREEAQAATDSGRERLAQTKADLRKELDSVAAQVRAQKEPLPSHLRAAREWTGSVVGQVETIDREMTHFDRQLTQGMESVREALQGLRAVADGMEEKLWYLAHHPWAFVDPPRGLAGLALDVEWRTALMRRHYAELRGELAGAQKGFQPRDASDQARANRIAEILQEMDRFLEVRPRTR